MGSAVAAVLYLGICAVILHLAVTPQRKLDPAPPPADLRVEPVHFESAEDKIRLAGWLLPSSGNRAIVLVHGVNSDGWCGAHTDIARAYVEAGFHVLVFDLRGHGLSGGDRIGFCWLERRDVRGAVDLLLSRGFQAGRIGIHGTSYGGATALLSTATIPELGAVVADSAFADMRDVMLEEIKRKIPWLPFVSPFSPGITLMGQLLYGLNFDTIAPERQVADIAPRPILFIHGSDDPIIPVEHASRLKAASGNPVNELWILEGYGHAEGVRMGPEHKQVSPMRDTFLKKVCTFFKNALVERVQVRGLDGSGLPEGRDYATAILRPAIACERKENRFFILSVVNRYLLPFDDIP